MYITEIDESPDSYAYVTYEVNNTKNKQLSLITNSRDALTLKDYILNHIIFYYEVGN